MRAENRENISCFFFYKNAIEHDVLIFRLVIIITCEYELATMEVT